MKKTLTQFTMFVFVVAISFNVLAQNGKQKRKDSNQKFNSTSMLMPGSALSKVHRNAPANLFPAAISGYYLEDFEGAAFPPTGWQALDILDPAGQWAQSPVLPYSGLNSAYCIYSGVGIDGEDWLIMPKFTVAATDSFTMWFAVQFVGYPPDSTFILVSTTDSLTSSFTNVIATLIEGVSYPTTQNVYQYYSFDLAAYAGQDVFVAIKNKNTFGDGIYVDKVSLGTKPALNAASVSIDLPSFIPAGTMSPMATFKNDGLTTQSFPVTMTTLGGYTSTKNITSLAAGTTQQVTFDPWLTTVPGIETISIQTQLAGDGLPADDTLSINVSVLQPFTNYGWVSKAPMTVARFDPASAAINSNDTSYLYAGSGITTGFTVTNDFGQYLPYSNSWSTVAAMNTGEFTASGAVHGNKIYVIGGFLPGFVVVPDNQIYDVATGTWSTGVPMPTPVGDFAHGVYHDSLFYYLGGYDGATGDLDIVQIYDPGTDTWTTGTSMPIAAEGIRGGIMGNKIIVTTGYSSVNGAPSPATYIGDIDPANPSSIIWAQWDDYPSGTNFRSGSGASLDESSGLVVFTGGEPGNPTGAGISDATFAFDFTTNSWKIGPPKITPVNNLCNLTSIVDNDSLWMASVGGYDGVDVKDVNEWLNMGPYVIVTGIDNNAPSASNFSSFPNPFVKSTDIKFSLSHNSDVKAVIVDVLGNEIEELCNKNFNSGNHSLTWNATNCSKGIYFCKLTVNGKSVTQKLLKY